MKITLFAPCFVDACFPGVAISMVEIFERLGHTVVAPPEAACCGQPAFNSGYWDEARSVAVKTLQCLSKSMETSDAVVIASGSCGAMIKVFYSELFQNTEHEAAAKALAPHCFEFSEFLVDKLKVTDLGAKFPHKVTFHDGCHGLRELKIQRQPRQLLKHVQGLELVEMPVVCCGFGGTFSAKFPMISTAMGEGKIANITATGADYVVSNDASCNMHIQGLADRQGQPIRSIHLAEILNTR